MLIFTRFKDKSLKDRSSYDLIFTNYQCKKNFAITTKSDFIRAFEKIQLSQNQHLCTQLDDFP